MCDEGAENLRYAIVTQAVEDYKRLLFGVNLKDEGVSTYEIEYFLNNSPWFTFLMNCDGRKILEATKKSAESEMIIRNLKKVCKNLDVSVFLQTAKESGCSIKEIGRCEEVVLFSVRCGYSFNGKKHFTDPLYFLWNDGKCIKCSIKKDETIRQFEKLKSIMRRNGL